MKYLVTGGAGFIGSHLVDALILAGHTVTVLDNLSTGSRENLNPKAIFYEIDLRDSAQLEKLDVFDGIFHLAALPSVQYSIEHPSETHDINVNSLVNILEFARSHNIKRIVYSASSAAYGDQDKLPLHETLEPRPMSPYALHKYIGEVMCATYANTYNMSTTSLRYFNVYGPRQRSEGAYASVISKFLSLREKGEPLTVTGTGEQTRDFIHVSDVVCANIAAMEKDISGQVFNIGSGIGSSVNKIATIIAGEQSKIIHIAPRIEPKASLADISKAKAQLGWEPLIPLESGLGELLKSIKSI